MWPGWRQHHETRPPFRSPFPRHRYLKVAAVQPKPDDKFGALLRATRLAAGMTQEELAERAGISARTVSDVERGLRGLVHHDTARRLADALELGDQARRKFEVAARGRSAVPGPPLPAGALPTVPTPFLGRARELDGIARVLQTPNVRLLTLTGAGGIGKTRLALETARRVHGSFPGGVFFVSLGELKDASLVAPEIAKAIGVVETGATLESLLSGTLAGNRALIVLDTFEHLTPAAPLVYSLMLSCPQTTFLVTSRSALRLRGELEFPVPPLEVPSDGSDVHPDDIGAWPATALFWERAKAVRPELELDRRGARLVVEICRKLDGLPLAIELAAARVRHLPLPAVGDQLEHRLQLLVGGPLDLPRRQRAIRDTVAWSHDLLGAREQKLFRRLSVFTGGGSLAAVQSVCGFVDDLGYALEGTSALVDQSLVVVDRNHPEGRFYMLDVVREYAALRLLESGEANEFARRHAIYYLTLAEEAEPNLVRAGHKEWFDRLNVERANHRLAMAWTIENGETALALRYTVALWRYWRHLGELTEGRRWSDAALAMTGKTPASLRAKALWAASALAFPQADHRRMAELAAEGIELARQSEDPMDLRNLVTIEGMVAMCQGRYSDAVEPFRRCIDICRPLGMSWQLATSYLNLGTALLHLGRTEEADATLQEALYLYRELGDDVFAARVTNTRAQVSLARDDIEGADQLARGALSLVVGQGERQGIAEGLEVLAAVAAARRDTDRAARLSGAAAAVRETIASRPTAYDHAITGRFLESVQSAVDAKQWRGLWDAGRALGAEAAVAYALATTYLCDRDCPAPEPGPRSTLP
jgi:predicted ATPase/DNA-binding XRE family transcriptional regulator